MKKLILFVYLLFVCAFHVSAQNANGLIAYYPLDNNAVDFGGFNYHGVMTGINPIADRFNYPNKAVFFNGYSSNIEVFKQFPDLKELTISFWFKLKTNTQNDINGNRTYIFWEGDALCGHDLAVGMSDNRIFVLGDKVGGVINGITGSAEINLVNELPALNGWYFFTWTMSATVSKLYLNGALKCTINSPGAEVGYHYNPTFGCLNDGNKSPCGTPKNSFFEGSVDEFKIFSKVQSPAQVLSHFQAGLVSSTFVGSPLKEKTDYSNFVIYPNPFNEGHIVKLNGPANDIIQMQIADYSGRIVQFTASKKNGQMELDLSGLPSGVYFVEIYYSLSDVEQKEVKKIIKFN